MKHVHVFASVEAGADQCVDCDTTRHNPTTVEVSPALAECQCGRGLARFVHGDHIDCAACFGEHVEAERQGVRHVA